MIKMKIELPNYCTICQKTFSSSTNLKNHFLTIHEKVFPFSCNYPGCNKKYSTENRLKFHQKLHNNDKSFPCNICDKSFNTRGDLKTHVKFHNEERPFKCSLCDKAYKTNEHLKEHMQIKHYGIKKYLCEYCMKRFGKTSALKAHIKTHTGEKTFKCIIPTCEKYFAEKGNMIIHYKRHLKRIEKINSKGCKEQHEEEIGMQKNISTDLTSFSGEKLDLNEVFQDNYGMKSLFCNEMKKNGEYEMSNENEMKNYFDFFSFDDERKQGLMEDLELN